MTVVTEGKRDNGMLDIEYINQKLREGLKASEIRKELDISEKRFLREVKELSYKFNQKTRQHEKIQGDNDMTLVTKNNKVDNEGMTLVTKELQGNMIQLSKDYERINKMLEWFENERDNSMTDVTVKISEGLSINYIRSKELRKTIRVDEKVYESLTELSKEYQQYSIKDLLSQAIYEFVNKYK